MTKQIKGLLAATLALGLAGCSDDETIVFGSSTPTVFGNVYALTSSNKLVSFVGSAPGTVISSVALTGIATGETVQGIDFRPATGSLYAFTTAGTTGYLYTVNTATALATKVATLVDDPAVADSGATYTALSGTAFAVDFNPVPDRLRIVSDAGQNLRVNVVTGGVAVDTAVNGTSAGLVSAAYTNSFGGGNAATLGTSLYAIDATRDFLVLLASPNGGTTADVGSSGLGFNGGTVSAFDIDGVGGAAYAALTASGGSSSRLFSVNLTTGGTTAIGTIGGGEAIKGIAIPSPAPALAYGVLESTNTLVSFTPSAPGTVTTIGAITGLQASEDILGIDVRPLTGQLYALGSTGRIYVLSTATGAATLVSGTPLTITSGGGDGLDFNPTVDRIRIVNDANQNLRANPDSGNLAATDTALTGATAIAAAAYDRNYVGGAATTLFNIDAGLDNLVRQGDVNGSPTSPNGGVNTVIGPLGVDTSDFVNFDIVGGHDGMVLATMDAAGANTATLYRINLATGAATSASAINVTDELSAFAVRLVAP